MIPALVVLVVGIGAPVWFATRPSDAGRGFGARLVVAGFALVPLSVIVGALTGNLSAVAFFIALLVLIVPVTALSLLTKRFYVGTLIVGLLTLLGSLAAGEFGLGRIDGFSDFAPSLLAVIGAATAVAGSIVALVQRRRDTRRPATPRQRWVVAVVALAVVAISMMSAVASVRGQTSLGSVPGAIVVDMRNDRFDPDRLTVDRGERVKVIAHNLDNYSHTFTIDDFGIDTYVGPRADRLITFTLPRSGRFVLSCVVSGHEAMLGTVVVES